MENNHFDPDYEVDNDPQLEAQGRDQQLEKAVEVLLQRVASRGIGYESSIDHQYLGRLAEAYTRFFFNYEEAPLVIVNAAAINLAEGDDDYNELLDQLRTVRKGRHYLNPLPF